MREFLAKTPDDCSLNLYYKDSNFLTVTKINFSQILIFNFTKRLLTDIYMLHRLKLKIISLSLYIYLILAYLQPISRT